MKSRFMLVHAFVEKTETGNTFYCTRPVHGNHNMAILLLI